MAGKVLKMKMWPDDNGGPVRDPSLFRNIAAFLIVIVETQCTRCQRRSALWYAGQLVRLMPLSLFLIVSQFTLLASTKKGNKPDFHAAAGVEKARELYDRFVAKVQELYGQERVKNGVFQAMMQVGLVNDGTWLCAQSPRPSTDCFSRSGKRRVSQHGRRSI